MSEKTDWTLLRDKIKQPWDRLDRVENGVGAGMPDVNFCANGVECWIEMKSPKEPVQPRTPLFGSNHRLSQDQKNWFKRQARAGGRGWILIGTDKRWILVDGDYADDVNQMTVAELIAISDWCITRPVRDAKQWEQLRNILTVAR